MKKKISGLMLALLLALSLCVPAMAATDYGVIYDETDLLGSPELTHLGEEALPALTRTVGIDLRVDVLTTISDYVSVMDAAAGLYYDYDYGYGDDWEAITLTILMEPQDDGSYAMPAEDGWYIFISIDEDEEDCQRLSDDLRAAVGPYLSAQTWNGEDMTATATALAEAVQSMAAVVSSYAGPSLPDAAGDAESDDTMRYVFDLADLLTYDEWRELEDRAADISRRHDCGVYFLTVDDFTEAGTDDVYEAAYHTYHNGGLGMGEGRDGIIVLLSMEERDYAMFVYGDEAEYAFDRYGQAQLEDEFLGYFGDDDWYGGISRYLDACDEYLTKAEAGTPVTGEYSSGSSESEPATPAWGIGLMVALSCMIAGAICMGLKRKMRTVYKKAEADAYVTDDGLRLTEEYDRYTHTTKTRRKIETESSSGGGSSSRSGGGGSGRSGKF